jgi:hypothetical protein
MMLSHFLKTLGGTLAACALTTTGLAQESLVTNVGRFQIPFEVEATPGEPRQGFAVLFGSQDGGHNWEQLQVVAAAQQNFQFAAPRDGVYAFAVRMMDAQGNLLAPIKGSAPELEVVIDTTKPDLRLDLYEVGSGQVMLNWQAADSNLDAPSLTLEYAEGQDGRWKPLQTERTASGQTSFQVPAGSVVSVRGTIRDTAFNRCESSTQLVLRAQATPPRSAPPAAGVGQTFNVQPMGPTPFAGSGQPAGFSGLSGPLVQTAAPVGMNTQFPASVVPATTSTQPLPATVIPATPGNAVTGSPGFHAGTVPQTVASQPVSGLPGVSGETQLVSHRVFDIVYQLEDVGPSGVSSVELFVTEDGGQQWFRYGNDADLRSPFQVDVQGEGTFGFAVRVRNGLGFTDPPPQPGEPPVIVVCVDQTPPAIDFPHPAVTADGEGLVNLAWTITDSFPAQAPVRLEYGVSPSGPWTPLFDWQPDSGNYQWPVRPGTPSALHFRLLARDAAGNVASAQTAQPVLIDLKRPTVSGLRIQAVSSSRPVTRGN